MLATQTEEPHSLPGSPFCVSQQRTARFIYDVAYWVFVPLLLLNMVSGIILDR